MSDQLSFRRMSYISSGGVNSPEISQDYNGNHEWSQRNGVPHCVNEIQTVKDLLSGEDNLLEHKQQPKIDFLG